MSLMRIQKLYLTRHPEVAEYLTKVVHTLNEYASHLHDISGIKLVILLLSFYFHNGLHSAQYILKVPEISQN
jgi:hypothetical protein